MHRVSITVKKNETGEIVEDEGQGGLYATYQDVEDENTTTETWSMMLVNVGPEQAARIVGGVASSFGDLMGGRDKFFDLVEAVTGELIGSRTFDNTPPLRERGRIIAAIQAEDKTKRIVN